MVPRIVALVPIKHNSESLPGKNYRPFAGRPLFHHILKSLLCCRHIAEVIIDTDSPVVLQGASRYFPQVKLVKRPDHLNSSTVNLNDVLLYDVDRIKSDFYLQTNSTNPLLTSDTISRAIQLFLKKRSSYDSLFSVTRVQSRLWDSHGRSVNRDPGGAPPEKKPPFFYEENSCLYIFDRDTMENHKKRIGERPLMFEIKRTEAWDIDEEADFYIAEFLYSKNAAAKDAMKPKY